MYYFEASHAGHVHFTVSVPNFSFLSTSSVGCYLATTTPGCRRRVLSLQPAELLASTPFSPAHQAILSVHVEAGQALIVVPALLDPQVEGAFRLSCYSENQVLLQPITPAEDWVHYGIEGSWVEGTAGGSRDKPTFKQNPQVQLTLSQPTKVFALLAAKDPQAVQSRFGLVVLQGADQQSAVSLGSEAWVWLDLPVPHEGESVVLVPCTSDAGEEGEFYLELYAENALEWKWL